MPIAYRRHLSDADHRRESALIAARTEFAEWGFHGATTAAIAKRADISHSYLNALFPSDRDAAKAYIAVSRLIDVAMAIQLPRELWPALPTG